MTLEQRQEVIDCLVAFVKRVSAEKDKHPAEVQVLPDVVRALNEL